MKAVAQMRAAGATVIIDKEILPESFFASVRKVNPQPYRKEGASIAFCNTSDHRSTIL